MTTSEGQRDTPTRVRTRGRGVRLVRAGQGSVRNESTDRRLGSRGRAVRWNETTGFELQCLACQEFWPITREFWRVPAIARCFACWREKARLWMAEVRRDPAVYAEHLRRYRTERRARRAGNFAPMTVTESGHATPRMVVVKTHPHPESHP